MNISTRVIIGTTTAVAAIALVGGAAIALWPTTPDLAQNARPTATATAGSDGESTAEPTSPAQVSPDASALSATDEMLLYMAEEEKLAMDVYDALGELWGSRIFTQISSSEATHQDRVLSLLDAAGLDDPRTGIAGTFVNDELQALYDDLMALGSTSPTAAFEVGVMIEERDIADLTDAIALTDDASVITVLDSLLSASQNHLSAFERQLS
jgi:hypothetical protein